MISAGAEEVDKLQVRNQFWITRQDSSCSQNGRFVPLLCMLVSYGQLHGVWKLTIRNINLVCGPRYIW